jgi:soluble lytic murein transglycosylase-like protein
LTFALLKMRFKLATFLVCAWPVAPALHAQPPANFEESVKAAMAPSISEQRASIRKQAAILPAARSSFFATPFVSTQAGEADCDPLPNEELEPLIADASRKTGVDAKLVRAVIDRESAGRPCALSARGAQGLMQLMPETAEDYDVDDPFDPQQNVEAGAKLLKSLLDRYKNDTSLALGAYNAGPTRVDQAEGVPPIPETVDYVSAILEKLRSVAASLDARKTPNTALEPAAAPAQNAGWSTLPPLDLKKF